MQTPFLMLKCSTPFAGILGTVQRNETKYKANLASCFGFWIPFTQLFQATINSKEVPSVSCSQTQPSDFTLFSWLCLYQNAYCLRVKFSLMTPFLLRLLLGQKLLFFMRYSTYFIHLQYAILTYYLPDFIHYLTRELTILIETQLLSCVCFIHSKH